MRTAEQTATYNSSRRGPKRRYRPTTKAAANPWPVLFRDGRPLPSDASVDSVITIFDGTGTAKEFIDPSTRMAIDAVTHRRIGFRIDPKEQRKLDATVPEIEVEVEV